MNPEHRQLAVLCCDIVGAEQLREATLAFRTTGTRIVGQFDGHVANVFDDFILAYFGWPRAHEDDADRAVRAGLALAQAVNELHTASGGRMAARVGIATGAVVVGEPMEQGAERRAAGAAPGLSERLRTLAALGQVVIDEATCRLLSPGFAVQPLGRHALAGMLEPMATYAVNGERPIHSRFDARKGRDLPPMVGREHELALLQERWAQAQGGEGGAVLLVGEAGFGKSRLTRALLDECAAQPHWRVRWQCSPYHTGSALWPVIQRLSYSAGLQAQDSTDTALDKLEALVGWGAEANALYATLLGLNGSQRYGPLTMTPQMLRESTLHLLEERLSEMAEQRPLLLVVEDAQWIDPTTLELLAHCLETIERKCMLLLITSRPDHLPHLGAHPGVMQLSLNRLGRAGVEAIVEQSGGASLQAQTHLAIVAQSDGVPLFAEELTKAVLETGEKAIPASLQGSLMARLDRMAQAKEVALIAACIGREFDHALVKAVAEPTQAVSAAIEGLVAAGLVFRRGGGDNPRFAFKHALVQEAACESLLRTQRQSIHARILDVLESERPGTAPELLAHHAACANHDDKAIDYWQQAGDAALAKSAYVEASGCYDSAIRFVTRKGVDASRRNRELELQLRLVQARIATQGNAAEAVRTALERAEELLDDDPMNHLQVHFGLWSSDLVRCHLREALLRTTNVLDAAMAVGHDEAKLSAQLTVAVSHLLLGELGKARDHFERAIAFHDPATRAHLVAQLGLDPRAAAHYGFAWTLCIQGFLDRSKEMLQCAHDIAGMLPQAVASANMHMFCGLCSAIARDVAAASASAAAIAELAGKHGLASYASTANNLLAWVALESGRPGEEAIAIYQRGVAQPGGGGPPWLSIFFLGGLATALAAAGRRAEALQTIEDAIRRCEDVAQGWCDAELWRVHGELLLGSPRLDEARASRCFERAVSIARQRGAKLWELRSAVSLARLWADQGKRAKALDLLAPVYGWFTEGHHAVDLVEARSLLTELDGRGVRLA